MERKQVALKSAFVDDVGGFEGYASVFDHVDLDNDVIRRGAFAGTLERFVDRGFVSWAHDWTAPIAMVNDAREDARGLWLSATFHSTADGQRARTIAAERVASGKMMQLSIGFRIAPGGARRRSDGVRELTAIDLHEVGLVMVGANELAAVTAVKSAAQRARPEQLRDQAKLALMRLELRGTQQSFKSRTRADDARRHSEYDALKRRARAMQVPMRPLPDHRATAEQFRQRLLQRRLGMTYFERI